MEKYGLKNMGQKNKNNRRENNNFYGKHHSEKTKKHLSEIKKGKHNSPNTEFKKGMISWNKGETSWIKGKHHTEETKKKIGEAHKGKIVSEETRNKMSKIRKGRKQSEKHIEKRIKSRKGYTHSDKTREKIGLGNLGKKQTEEAKRKISLVQIGKKLSKETINKIIKNRKENNKIWHSEETKRKIGESNKYSRKAMGKEHWNWLNGKSFEPYDERFNKLFKEAIKIRDNESCMICGSNKSLQIHHVDYNKLNSIKENCCTLCNSCHVKTNFNREHWTKFFRSLLLDKYNYYYIIKVEEIK